MMMTPAPAIIRTRMWSPLVARFLRNPAEQSLPPCSAAVRWSGDVRVSSFVTLIASARKEVGKHLLLPPLSALNWYPGDRRKRARARPRRPSLRSVARAGG